MPDPPRPADWAREVRTRLASLRLSPTREADIVDELSQHLDDRYRELTAGGASEADATRLTLAEFREGNLLARYMAPLRQSRAMSSASESSPTSESASAPASAFGSASASAFGSGSGSASRSGSAPGSPSPSAYASAARRLLHDVGQDLRYAVRTFLRQPGFAAAAVLTLALGIGANSAIFSVVRGVLLESLPFKEAVRLYRLRMVYPDGSASTMLSAPDFMSVRDANRVFDQVDAYTAGIVTMLGGGDAQEVRAASVSDGLFELLGLRVVAGRAFLREEHSPGRNGVALLDHGFWQRAFGGHERAIGRSITIGGGRYAIVGVLARGARLPADVPGARVPSEADVYLPIEYGEAFHAATAVQRRSNYLGVLVRAKVGVTPTQIDEDLRRMGRELQAAFPQTNEGLTMSAISARDLIVGDVRQPLLMLLGAVGFVLLVACANVASLMLARASARRDELAVRAALGARRGRLLRQLLTEAVVLGLVGGTLGLALAYAGTAALVAAQPADIPRLEEIGLDRTVVLFTCAITLLASLVFGAVPALQATGHLTSGLRTGRRGGSPDRRAQRVRAGLVVCEVALAVVLLAGAGLLLRSLVALTQVAPGFTSENTAALRIALYGRGYDLDAVRARVTEFEAALRLVPGVTAAGTTSVLPLSGPGSRQAFAVEGAPPPPTDVNPEIGVASVTPEYLKTIGATLLRGRDFTDRDHAKGPLVAIVNEAAVRRWFPDGTPIGKRVQMGGTREIVGVIADVLQGDPKQETTPQLFVPYAQRPIRSVRLVVRTGPSAGILRPETLRPGILRPEILAPSLRAAIRRFDQDLAVSELTSLDQLRAGVIARPRFYTALLALFAAVALALAATGIFGVMSYTVAERTREIGIRLALGAHRADVLRMIVGRALALALTGAAIGFVAALAIGRVIRHQLFGVDVLDLPTLGAVILILLASAAAASLLPAQRAARLDPGSTLRHG